MNNLNVDISIQILNKLLKHMRRCASLNINSNMFDSDFFDSLYKSTIGNLGLDTHEPYALRKVIYQKIYENINNNIKIPISENFRANYIVTWREKR